MRHWPGTPYPLGATWDGGGTNFAVFSEVAEAVELCLFDGGDGSASTDPTTPHSASPGPTTRTLLALAPPPRPIAPRPGSG